MYIYVCAHGMKV